MVLLMIHFQHQMLFLFQTGLVKEFFDLWKDNIPEAVDHSDENFENIEFLIIVYFALFPLKFDTKVRMNMQNSYYFSCIIDSVISCVKTPCSKHFQVHYFTFLFFFQTNFIATAT